MKQVLKLLIAAGLILTTIQPATAFFDQPTITEYRELLTRYAVLIGDENATSHLENLTSDGWQTLYESHPGIQDLASTVRYLENLAEDSAMEMDTRAFQVPTISAIEASELIEGGFAPRYPDVELNSSTCASMAGPCYASYIRRDVLGLPNLLFTAEIDTGQPGVQDDRCSEQTEAVLRHSMDSLHGLALSAQASCDMSPDFVSFGTCTAAAAAWALEYGTEQKIQVCGFHGGNVDSAEIEAAYENTRRILQKMLTNESTLDSQVEDINEQLATIKEQIEELKAGQEEIIKLLKTPAILRPGFFKEGYNYFPRKLDK